MSETSPESPGSLEAGVFLPGLLDIHPRVATREESGVLGFPSRRGLTPRDKRNRQLRTQLILHALESRAMTNLASPSHSSSILLSRDHVGATML